MNQFSKAIAGGLATLIVALAARYGFNASPDTLNWIGMVLFAVVSYGVGHVVVFFAPANKVVALTAPTALGTPAPSVAPAPSDAPSDPSEV